MSNLVGNTKDRSSHVAAHFLHRNMTLGKVDSLGQFVSEFVPDPDHHGDRKSGGSRFFKSKKDKEKVRQFVIPYGRP